MSTQSIHELTGADLRGAFRLAFQRLTEMQATVNALNVFPVPDGDTGTNMSLTLRSGIERCPDDDEATAGEVAQELAKGAFFGARGNSGVILSQFLKGFSEALQDRQMCTAADLVQALESARTESYAAVGSPREGTMLTVIRRAAEAVREAETTQAASVLETAYRASCIALRNTPEQLAVLKEAGVVDSGGLGVVIIIGGALEALSPEHYRDASAAERVTEIIDASMASLGGEAASPDEGFVHSSLDEAWGYCTEFIINGSDLNKDVVRRYYEEAGRSTVVVGDSNNVRVHVHMQDPGAAISYGVSLGIVSNVKVENMDQQNVAWAEGHRAPSRSAGAPQTVVAVAAGKGLANLFAESGCGHVIEGGQTMNPSVQQLIEGVEFAGAEQTIILPNNKNIILTANHVAAESDAVHVVPTRSIPQGIAALLAYNPLSTVEENLAAMTAALPDVRTIEVTRAVRDTTIEGISVGLGDYIALIDDRLALRSATAEGALTESVAFVGTTADSLLTVFLGADANPDAATSCLERLQASNPELEIEQVYGGQPHYQYLASVE